MRVYISHALKYALQSYHFRETDAWHIFTLSGFMQTFAGSGQKKFKKKSLSCCSYYTKQFTFVSRKQVRERIIWFYLVRAEVVHSALPLFFW